MRFRYVFVRRNWIFTTILRHCKCDKILLSAAKILSFRKIPRNSFWPIYFMGVYRINCVPVFRPDLEVPCEITFDIIFPRQNRITRFIYQPWRALAMTGSNPVNFKQNLLQTVTRLFMNSVVVLNSVVVFSCEK